MGTPTTTIRAALPIAEKARAHLASLTTEGLHALDQRLAARLAANMYPVETVSITGSAYQVDDHAVRDEIERRAGIGPLAGAR